jgi:hypothetical protein
MVEYRHTDAGGGEHVIIQPRVLAQTAIIERHVIRSEVAGVAIDAVESAPAASPRAGSGMNTPALPRAASETGNRWRHFVERFVTDTRFDDPGQPAPRSGGTGWIRVPLPEGLHINVWRSLATGRLGTQVRFAGTEQRTAFEELAAERDAIDAEFAAQGLEAPDWHEGDVPEINLSMPAPQPWNDAVEAEQRAWMSRRTNQLVNSLRPRLRALHG